MERVPGGARSNVERVPAWSAFPVSLACGTSTPRYANVPLAAAPAAAAVPILRAALAQAGAPSLHMSIDASAQLVERSLHGG